VWSFILDASDVKCFGVYGCFPIDDVFYTENRPYNTHPETPAKIGLRFPVFTYDKRDMPAFIDVNDPDHLKTLGINPNGWIYFLSHGYVEAGDRPWVNFL
jgi:pancreatic triacylglycerol lipase